MDQNKDLPTTLFLHIPKTAGTTLHFISSRQYTKEQFHLLDHQPDILNLSAEQRQALRFLKGHYWFGMHEYVSHPFTYVTMLRKPIKRVVSLYDQARRLDSHNMYEVANRYTLAELYEQNYHKEAFDNGQTRLISGVWDAPPFGGVTAEIFEQAKHNLTTYFSCIGTTERFDETLLLFKNALQWQNIYYHNYNMAGKKKEAKTILSPADHELISRYNQWDQQLYTFANQWLDDEIARQGDRFQAQLSSFQTRNKMVQPFLYFYWEVVRKVSVRTIFKQMVGKM